MAGGRGVGVSRTAVGGEGEGGEAGASLSGEGSLAIAARYANGLRGPGGGFGGESSFELPFLRSFLLPFWPFLLGAGLAAFSVAGVGAATTFAGGGVGMRRGGSSACTACESRGCSVMPPSDETLRPRHTRTSYFCRASSTAAASASATLTASAASASAAKSASATAACRVASASAASTSAAWSASAAAACRVASASASASTAAAAASASTAAAAAASTAAAAAATARSTKVSAR